MSVAGLAIAGVAVVCGVAYTIDKLKGKNPESDMFTGFFALIVASSVVMTFTALVLQFIPHTTFQHYPLLAIPALIPTYWIFMAVFRFFSGPSE